MQEKGGIHLGLKKPSFPAPKLKKCPDILLYQGKTINFYNYVFEWRAQLEPVGILRLRSPP